VTAAAKGRLALTILATALRAAVAVRQAPLPTVVAAFGSAGPTPGATLSPRTLSRAVDRVLDVGPHRTRCVIKALVLFRLLRGRDVGCDVVIGLPSSPTDKDAHAWVEVRGIDIGPAPGRLGHAELVRYP
jgi:hypothetical protein